MNLKYVGWTFFILFAISIGIYPLFYWVVDMSSGLLASKSEALLQNALWHACFYTHISFGGISLLSGWSQFSNRLRLRYLALHRWLGKLYVISVLLSGITGLYIAFYATGGLVSAIGFSGLAIAWLFCTFNAYRSIRQLDIQKHQQWMIRSYALTFAAVTLRIWIPLFQIFTPLDFISSYKIIAWLCWVPNLIVAEWMARKVNGVAANAPSSRQGEANLPNMS